MAIALALRTYKKMYVTTAGQMFQKENDAEEAVRLKNAIVDDPELNIGLVELTEDMVTIERLREIGKNPDLFNALFKDARIPKQRAENRTNQFERKREQVNKGDAKEVDELKAALGLAGESATSEEEAKKKAAEELVKKLAEEEAKKKAAAVTLLNANKK